MQRRLPAVRTALASALLLVAVALAVPSQAAACASTAGAVQPRPGGWTTVAVPDFPQHNSLAAPTLQMLWSSPVDPKVMLASNFYTVMRTADGGCTWKPVYALSTQPAAATAGVVPWDVDGRVKQIKSAQVGQVVFLVVYTVDAPRVLIVRSSDGGLTWKDMAGTGLPPVSQPRLFPVPTNPDYLYLTASPPSFGYSHYIFASTDGGASWSQRSGPADDTAENSTPLAISIDPKDPLNLWLYGGLVGMRHSTDGGKSWVAVPSYTFECAATQICRRDASSVALVPHNGKPTEVWICPDVNQRPDGKFYLRRSLDGGKTFGDVLTRDRCVDLLTSSTGTVVLSTYTSESSNPPSEANVYRYDAKRGFVAFSPQQYKPRRQLSQPQLSWTARPTLTGVSRSTDPAIERWTGRL